MATYYVDYAGSAGTGDGSSFANRADKVQSIWPTSGNTTLLETDEIRVKGNPVTSLGTASIGDTSRTHMKLRAVEQINVQNRIIYSTTTGETKIEVGALGNYGWVTGDRIMVVSDTAATAANQPSLIGIHEITTDGTDYTSSFAIKINGYTANSNGTHAGTGIIKFVVANGAIKLNTTGLFKSIACMEPGRSAWSTTSGGSASIEAYNDYSWSQTTTYRWGAGTDELTISSGTGKKCWYQLPSALDLSGYQQVSFLVKCTTSGYGERLSTPDTLRLCTDTNGDTSVHTIPIDFKGRENGSSSGFWPITVDLGVNLNASIQSIALYREAHQSPVTFYIQNVVACKASSAADSITHSSCIGLKEANNPIWCDVDVLWNDWVLPVQGANQKTTHHGYYNNPNYYWSNSGSAVNVYKVEPFRLDLRGFTDTYFDRLYIQGTGNNSNTGDRTVAGCTDLKGAWSDNDMQTCSGDYATILHGDQERDCFYCYQHFTDMNVENISFHRWHQALVGNSNVKRIRFKNVGFLDTELNLRNGESFGFDCSYFLAANEGMNTYYTSQHVNSSKNDFNFHCVMLPENEKSDFRVRPQNEANMRTDKDQFGTIRIAGNYDTDNNLSSFEPANDTADIDNLIFEGGSPDRYIQFGDNLTLNIGTLTLKNGNYYTVSGEAFIDQINRTAPERGSSANPALFGNTVTPYAINASANSKYVINGGTMSGWVANQSIYDQLIDGVTHTGLTYIHNLGDGYIKWRNYQGTSGDHRTMLGNALATPDTTIRHTASGTSLKIDITTANANKVYKINLGKIVVNANSQVTVSVWAYNTSTAEDITLRVKRSDWMGVTSNQDVSMTAGNYTADTWTQISKSFTPTSAGVLDIQLLTTGTSTNSTVYFDDFEVSQV